MFLPRAASQPPARALPDAVATIMATRLVTARCRRPSSPARKAQGSNDWTLPPFNPFRDVPQAAWRVTRS